MKKILAFVLMGLLVFSSALTVYAKPDKAKHELKIKTETKLEAKGETKNKVEVQTQTKLEASVKAKEFKGKVSVNKKEIKFDIPPVIKEGRTLIPVRAIMNGFGAKVDWDEETKIVTITKGDITIQLVLGETKVLVNGKEYTLDVPAMEISNRTFVPVRFISEILGGKVNYDKETGDIEIEEEDQTEIENNSEESTVSQDVYANTNETVTNSVYGTDEEVEGND
ncbi:copper amine oxidase N-terminal domain-containing protein [Thermoanaerobacter siderophilus]|uniref:Copper amine oxidase family protein n=1 Tax=Thermoanaerobacter siderophilus SR4 TaxID=880478 RepID=I9AAM5_9THEO|nr:copper amine oxidase N-terminal domain-containing protein [Thermoanaerobacter siderophilus]EIV99066.1 copper amine oxidase family protein [Thermoanaerobacter siderophilus SR4]